MADEPKETPLERAMIIYLAAIESGSDMQRLADEHPELRDLLEPMVHGATPDEPDEADVSMLGGYRLLQEIGRGGMGIVYEVWESALDRKLALKVLTPGLVTDPGAVARFRREAAAAGRLRHPGIVEVLQFGVDAGRHFFVMELVDGPSLHACKQRFHDVGAATALAQQVLEALQHAHDRGLVHRDVKPANILIRADGHAVVSDFGLASDERLPSLTQAGAFLGTLDYASPEQVRGEPVDARSDVFAVGVVLHELLAGTHPFRHATQESTLRRVLEHEPPPLHQLDHRIPRDLAAIVARALHKDRQRRYASAAAMALDLQALRQGKPVSVRLPSAPERLWRWLRREPWRAAAAVLVVLGALGLAGGAGYWTANAPNLKAGARAIAERARDELLTEAWLGHTDDPAGALRLLEGHDELAADEETVLLRCLALRQLGRPSEADAVLRSIDTPATQRLLSGKTSAWQDVADADPRDPFVAFVDGIILYKRAQDIGPQTTFLEAATHLQRAVMLSGAPRSSFLTSWMQAAARGGDAKTFELAKAVLERHFPDLPSKRQVIAILTATVDPKAGLPLVEALEREARDDAERARWAYNVGVACRALNRTADAEAAFRRCVAASPTYAPGWNHLGILLRSAGRVPEAIEAYERAIAAAPTQVRAWFNLGNARQQQRDLDSALGAYQKATELQPGYARAHNGVGVIHLELDHLDDAAAAFERALAIDPQLPEALSNLSQVHARAERFAEALPLAERAVKLRPDNPSFLLNLAEPATRVGSMELARKTTAQLVKVMGGDGRAWVHRAWALLMEPAEAAEATSAAARAIELAREPQAASARLAAACAAVAAGDAEAARTHLREFDAFNQAVPAWEQKKLEAARQWLQAR